MVRSVVPQQPGDRWGESLDDTLKFLREDPTTKHSDYVRLALED